MLWVEAGSPKLPTCKPKVEGCDTLQPWESKEPQELWPNGFHVNSPLEASFARRQQLFPFTLPLYFSVI